MKKTKISKILELLIFAAIVVGLFLPYHYDISLEKVDFAYQSIQRRKFNYEYETIYLGIHTIFGWYNLAFAVILVIVAKKRKEFGALLLLLLIYLVSLLVDAFLNNLAHLLDPMPYGSLYGGNVLVVGTLALCAFYMREWLRRANASGSDKR